MQGPGKDAGRPAHPFNEEYEFTLLAANMLSANQNEPLATPVSTRLTE